MKRYVGNRTYEVVAIFLSLYPFVPLAFSQAGGMITGRVLDQTDALIPGVSVELLPSGATEHLEVFTQGDGTYRFDNVPPGPAQLTFRLINFSTVRRSVVVQAGGTIAVDALLVVTSSADITITAPMTFRNLAELDNPAENIVGVARAGSEGAITAAQLTRRPFNRAAEVLEAVPGMVISQHSGEGKAPQYYLRGFNLDHGFDFSQTIAGIPVNMPTHAHAQGYADSNFLIPELVSGIQFRKGPYYAEDGDFSAVGAANINYFNRLERPMASISGGSDKFFRFFGAVSPRVGPGHLLAAVEWATDDGPWEHPNSHPKKNGVIRYSQGDSRNGFSLTGMGYSSHWHSTDQVPQRAIDSGLIGRFGLVEPNDGGKTFRYSVASDWQRSSTNASTRINAYVQRYGVSLLHNFTYFLNDPVNGDQFEQFERRWVTGGQVTHRRLGHFGAFDAETAFGVRVRNDSIGGPLGLFLTSSGQRRETVRADDVDQFSVGMFGQTEISWSPVFRTTFGLRGDVFHYDVTSSNPLNSGKASTGIVSPKVSSVFGPWGGTEFYANWGLGFHSNSGLGATLAVDPVTGDPVERSSPIVRARGAEFGVRTVAVPRLQSTVSVWYLGFDSELFYVGDSGSTEIGPPSRRVGIEITNYYHPHSWVTMDTDLSFSRARFLELPKGNDLVPGALNRVISGGIAVQPPEGGAGPIGSLRLRHFGPRPLLEDGSIKSSSSSIVNGEIGYKFSDRLRLVLEGFNLFDAKVSDIEYYYASRLPGEPEEGVEDIHLHPALPRSARISLRVSF
jgi:hypothetical protein